MEFYFRNQRLEVILQIRKIFREEETGDKTNAGTLLRACSEASASNME